MSLSRSVFLRLSRFLSARNIYLSKSLTFRKRPAILPINFDFVRYTTLELCYEEITARKLKGNIAELGVYKGEFAKRLNVLFPERKLYLFDTFEGFAEKDVAIEQNNGFSTGKQDFSDTSLDLVLGKMIRPENCIVKKGTFPETAADVADTFCFVSLDADLYEPIYQGLKFFYPMLEQGGYIFIHDFNNAEYHGARQAVTQFCSEQKISFVPIPDNGGSAIITK